MPWVTPKLILLRLCPAARKIRKANQVRLLQILLPTLYIPHHNGYEMLAATLASTSEQTHPCRVVVIDNASQDGSAARVAKAFPDVELIELGLNRGFGSALNLAVSQSPADVLIFINNDVVLEPTFVAALLDSRSSDTGAVAGVLLRSDDPDVIDCAGITIDERLTSYEYLSGEPAAAAAAAEGPLGPTGAAALFELDTFNELGGFDERLFAYQEDVDLVLRLRTAGIKCAFAPFARGIHRGSATLGARSRRVLELNGYGRGYLLHRYRALTEPRRAADALATEVINVAVEAATAHTLVGLRARVRGWRAANGLPSRHMPDGLLPVSRLSPVRSATRNSRALRKFRRTRRRWAKARPGKRDA